MEKSILKVIVIISIAGFIIPRATVLANEKNISPSDIFINDAGLSKDFYDEKNEISEKVNVLDSNFYAYNAYDPTSVLELGPVYFESDNPGTITLLAPTTSYDFIAGATWVKDTWYGCEFGTGRIYIIDESNGEMTLIGGGGAGLNGLAYDPITNTMYGAGNSNLYIINMSNGIQTLVGGFGTGGLMIAIAFDDKGNLYGIDIYTDNLYSIDPSIGAAMIIGSLGIDILFAQDAAYDMDNGILYLSAFVMSPVYGGHLYTCDIDTGICTLIGKFQGGAEITGFAIPYTSSQPILEIGNISGGIFKTSAVIKNSGGVDASVDWNITLDGGFILLGKETSGRIYISADDEAMISSNLIIGFGKTVITVTAECAEGSSDTKTRDSFIFVILII